MIAHFKGYEQNKQKPKYICEINAGYGKLMLTETNLLQHAHTAKTKTKMTNDKWGDKGVHKSKCSRQ